MDWGWYLQNDIQLFFYCLIIMILYRSSRFWSFFTIFLSMVANFAFVMSQTYNNEEKILTHLSDFAQSQKYLLDIYLKPWGRCPPYLYGLLLGLLYYEFLEYENKIKDGKKGSLVEERSI